MRDNKLFGAIAHYSHFLMQKFTRAFRAVFSFVFRHKITASSVAVFLIVLTLVLVLFLPREEENRSVTGSNASYVTQLPTLKDAVGKNPKDAEARKAYAVALYATNDKSEAVKQYREAVKLNPKDATSYNNLGNALRDLKKYDEAVAAYEQSLTLNGKSVNTYANLANVQFYSLNNHKGAFATYDKGLKALPGNKELLSLLANAYEVDGQKKQALAVYGQLLNADPDSDLAKAAIERLK
jgi:tetratricopeptide (TPR) repeat protein